jgi:hypothetical protein
MSRSQFYLLNTVSVLLVVFLLTHFALARYNDRTGNALAREQAAIGNTRQVEAVLEQLAKRIARGSDTDPRLAGVLRKNALTVTLDVAGKKKAYPAELAPSAQSAAPPAAAARRP